MARPARAPNSTTSSPATSGTSGARKFAMPTPSTAAEEAPAFICGKEIRRRPQTYVDRVAKLRNPTSSATRAERLMQQGRSLETPQRSGALRPVESSSSTPPVLQSTGSSSIAQRRRRANDITFTPPTLSRSSPTLFGSAPAPPSSRDLAAAFSPGNASPPPTPSRTAPFPGSSVFPTFKDCSAPSSMVPPTPTSSTLPKSFVGPAGDDEEEDRDGEVRESSAAAAASRSSAEDLRGEDASSNAVDWRVQPAAGARQRRRLSRSVGGTFKVSEEGGGELRREGE